MSNYYWQDVDPDIHPEPFGADTVGIVSERDGGIVAYCHATNADALVNSLNGTH